MSSEIFENREDDFKTILADIKSKLERLPNNKGENRKRICREVERGLEEANILVGEMEEEARKAPGIYRMDMINKVKQYREETNSVGRQMASTKQDNAYGMRPAASGFYDEDDFESIESSQRARLLQGTQSLNETSNSLARIHTVAAETDEIGTEIITELGMQRETLVRTKDRLHNTDVNLSRSRKILNAMGRRIITNKLILAVIIVMELAILGGVVYWKFFS